MLVNSSDRIRNKNWVVLLFLLHIQFYITGMITVCFQVKRDIIPSSVTSERRSDPSLFSLIDQWILFYQCHTTSGDATIQRNTIGITDRGEIASSFAYSVKKSCKSQWDGLYCACNWKIILLTMVTLSLFVASELKQKKLLIHGYDIQMDSREMLNGSGTFDLKNRRWSLAY